ncbi:MAG: DUF4382 domain-containing protein [Gemmatimonadales bacterium]
MLAAVASGCYEDDSSGPGTRKPMVEVLLTDAPFPFDTVQSVNVYIVSIAASTAADTSEPGGQEWITITEPRRRVDLLELQQGTTTLMGEGELSAAQYRAVRVIIDVDSSGVMFRDGAEAVVHWGGSGAQAIHAFVEAALAVPEDGEPTEIVIDFDVGRSFHWNDLGDNAFTFLPWIRAVNEAATGSIAGTVLADAGPIENATISAYGATEGTWEIRSTGKSDALGNYRIAYLLPGTYIVEVDPPPSVGQASALDSSVVVTTGMEMRHDVSLGAFEGSIVINGASSMVVNRTKDLEAVVVNSQRQRVVDPTVDWENLDPDVLSLAATTNDTAAVTSVAVGQGRIVATSGDLSDTLTITVYPDSSQNSAPAPASARARRVRRP